MKEKISPNPLYLRIKESLQAATDQQLAELMEVTPQSINGWKRSGKIKRDRIKSVADRTGVSYAWLLTGEGEKFPAQKQPQPELLRSIGREQFARSISVSVSPQSFHSLPVTTVLSFVH